ncbi:uncharacterized protein BYT42DRAFT_613745 [Radiomyces spectabilis]|uniref:uncharacterized protein n=1 Tax=Radiomyces spectabilis TaxID=64574 RepID=UPI00221F19B6|nr:uncharacterized protein BYT42DRAFT_613745 [Radiomyces spectabilis]KAI8379438.1 hypothetical protein BYT42DRAFT_613745 [Radiomyces spectabilis]
MAVAESSTPTPPPPRPPKGTDDPEPTPIPPTVPPPPPAPYPETPEDSNALLSPWWSVEPPPEAPPPEKNKGSKNGHIISLFRRTATREEQINGQKAGEQHVWTEWCALMTAYKKGETQDPAKDDPIARIKNSPKCSLMCFIKEDPLLTRNKLEQTNQANTWNPFYGKWIVTAVTQAGCLEHLQSKTIVESNSNRYHAIELGKQLEKSGENVKRMLARTFTPMQALTKRYIESWKDGTQATFFSRFWESVERGDAFRQIRDSTKRIIENATKSSKRKSNDDHRKDDNDNNGKDDKNE